MFTGLYKIASIRALALASVFSIFAGPTAQAGGSPTGHGGEWRSGALITDTAQGAKWKPMVKSPENGTRLATEGAPSNPGDHNGRADLSSDPHSMLATEGPPGTAGDHNG